MELNSLEDTVGSWVKSGDNPGGTGEQCTMQSSESSTIDGKGRVAQDALDVGGEEVGRRCQCRWTDLSLMARSGAQSQP